MKFSVARDELLRPLQMVVGVVERRQTLPILANVLINLQDGKLSLTGTDLEVEIVGYAHVEGDFEAGDITVPARKLLDIVKSLPDNATLQFEAADGKSTLKAGRSRFTLTTLPANEFPNVEEGAGRVQFTIAKQQLKKLIDKTAFAMAQQDVRYYLNGMLFEVSANQLRLVATDGHRLALCDGEVETGATEKLSVILPRKGVMELSRLLNDDSNVDITIGANHLLASAEDLRFTSKLVDGAYPDYDRVLPKGGDKNVVGDRQELKQAFSRTAILSNEKYRGVRLQLTAGQLKMVANNPEQEEAQEEVTINYGGEELEIGFNVSYLLDVLNVLDGEGIEMVLSDANSSAILQDPNSPAATYVVMPMRL